MMFRRSLLTASALSICSGAFAQSPPASVKDDPALDAAAAAQQIEALARGREQWKNQFLEGMREQLLHTVQNSGASGNFVIDCYRKVQFEGRSGGGNDFSKWKKDNPDIGSNRDVEKAARFHLWYLAITAKRAMSKDAGPVQQDLKDYLDMMTKEQELLVDRVREPDKIKLKVFDPKEQKFSGEIIGNIQGFQDPAAVQREQRLANLQSFVQNLLNDSVDQGWVGRALNVNACLGGIPDWTMTPGDFSAILEQDVRSYLRENKDPRLPATWDYEIAYLGSAAKLKKDSKFLTEFNQLTLPRLLWKKAQDMEKIGMPNRALNLEISLVQQYPKHPDFVQWAGVVEAALKKQTGAAAGAAKKESPTPQPSSVQ